MMDGFTSRTFFCKRITFNFNFTETDCVSVSVLHTSVPLPNTNISPQYTSHFRVQTDTRALNLIHFTVTNTTLQAHTECEYPFLVVQFKSRTRLQVKCIDTRYFYIVPALSASRRSSTWIPVGGHSFHQSACPTDIPASFLDQKLEFSPPSPPRKPRYLRPQ